MPHLLLKIFLNATRLHCLRYWYILLRYVARVAGEFVRFCCFLVLDAR